MRDLLLGNRAGRAEAESVLRYPSRARRFLRLVFRFLVKGPRETPKDEGILDDDYDLPDGT